MRSPVAIATALATVLIALLAGVVLLSGSPVEWSAVALLLLISGAPAVLALLRETLFEDPRALIGLSFFFFYGLSAAGAVIGGESSRPSFWSAFASTLAGLLAAYLAYEVALRPAERFVAATGRPVLRWKPQRLLLAVVVLAALGGIGLQARFAAVAPGAFSHRGADLPVALQTERLAGVNWSIPLLAAPAVALALLWAWSLTNRSRWSLAFLLPGAALYYSCFVRLGSRSRLLIVVVAAFVLWGLLRRRVSRSVTVAVAFLVLAGYVAFGQIRVEFGTKGSSDFGFWQESGFASHYLAEHGDVAEFRATMDVIERYPADYPFRWGSTLLTPVTTWVPRSLWPGKPDSAAALYSAQFTAKSWERGVSTPPGLIGEFYLNAGHPGVLLGMGLVGLLAALARAYVRLYGHEPAVAIVYALCCLPFAVTARGDVAFVGGSCIDYGVFALLGFLLTGSSWRRTTPVGDPRQSPYLNGREPDTCSATTTSLAGT